MCPFISFTSASAAKSCQTNNQSKTFSFLSQLALSSQNKFFLRSPPKFRKRATEGGAAPDCPDGELATELDGEVDSSESQSPTSSQYENCLSAGLDCAISDLISLDSQAEVEQGSIQIKTGRSSFFLPRCSSCSKQNPKLSALLRPLHLLKRDWQGSRGLSFLAALTADEVSDRHGH